MIPVTDAVRAQRLPIVNVAIILACIAVFVYELTLSLPELNRFFFDYSVIPDSLNAWANHPSGLRVPSTIFTSARFNRPETPLFRRPTMPSFHSIVFARSSSG